MHHGASQPSANEQSHEEPPYIGPRGNISQGGGAFLHHPVGATEMRQHRIRGYMGHRPFVNVLPQPSSHAPAFHHFEKGGTHVTQATEVSCAAPSILTGSRRIYLLPSPDLRRSHSLHDRPSETQSALAEQAVAAEASSQELGLPSDKPRPGVVLRSASVVELHAREIEQRNFGVVPPHAALAAARAACSLRADAASGL